MRGPFQKSLCPIRACEQYIHSTRGLDLEIEAIAQLMKRRSPAQDAGSSCSNPFDFGPIMKCVKNTQVKSVIRSTSLIKYLPFCLIFQKFWNNYIIELGLTTGIDSSINIASAC